MPLIPLASTKNLRQGIKLLLQLLLLLILLIVFIPLSPKMPAIGLDTSWALGLNQAVAQGLIFGKELIFTLGPYSAIYTKMYHPATDLMMIFGSLYLAFSYWLAMLVLMQGIKWRWIILSSFSLVCLIYARDSLLFSYPLLIGLVCFKQSYSSWDERKNLFISILFFAPFGLLPLIKGSFLILTLAMMLLCSLFFIARKKKSLMLVCLAVPILTIMLFWAISGQSICYLPQYISSSLSLAFSFTQAMAFEGNRSELILYAITSVLILLIINRQPLNKVEKLFLSAVFFVFLFLSFKAGFTRHYGHAFVAGTSILLAGLMLAYLFDSKLITAIVFISIGTTGYIDGQYTQVSLHKNFLSVTSAAWHGLKLRLTDPNWLKNNFDLSMQFIAAQNSFPPMPGKTDVYSYNQTDLIATTALWSPRPIFQSYSVFTADLAKKNRDYLLSQQRPDHILFKVEPIDGRIPALEDGLSWPVLMKNYKPLSLINDFLYLQTKNNSPLSPQLTIIANESRTLGELVKVKDLGQPLFVEIDIKPSWFGQLASFFFKPSSLSIRVELKNGMKKKYRMIANMANAGFILSPLVENTEEFALLVYNHKLLNNKLLQSFIISPEKNNFCWEEEYHIRFYSVQK